MEVKRMVSWGLVFFMIVATGFSVTAQETAGTYREGIDAYNRGAFDVAAEIFSTLSKQGITNPKLFYNAGNAYFKNKDLGRAILWYERAHQLVPDDPDLNFNLDFARSRVKDENEEKKNPIFRILFFWKYMVSHKTIQWTAIFLNSLFFLVLTFHAVLKKKTPRWFGLGICAMIVLFAGTALFNDYEDKFMKHAVIVSERVPVRAGWAKDATPLFELHAGTKVKVEKEQNGFYRIYFSEGKIGWLHKNDAEII